MSKEFREFGYGMCISCGRKITFGKEEGNCDRCIKLSDLLYLVMDELHLQNRRRKNSRCTSKYWRTNGWTKNLVAAVEFGATKYDWALHKEDGK